MIHNKTEFYGGIAALVGFFIVLFMMFQPLFNGQNGMAYLDNLYNSISKGSIDYIPGLKEDAAKYNDKKVTLEMVYASEVEAKQSAALFAQAGAEATASGTTLAVSGSLGKILDGSLNDANLMYHNDGKGLQDKYGLEEPRRPLYNWWNTLILMDKGLKDQGEFAAAKITKTVHSKAVEASYNYYKVEPIKISDHIGMVIFSLAFYVFYTLWYGFAILWVFEGWGLNLSH